MIFNVFKMTDDRNRIYKRKTNKTTFTIQLKRIVNVQNPEIIIQSELDLTEFNYAEIPYFNRFYFIEEIEPFPNNTFKLRLRVDVLESFSNDILSYGKAVSSEQSVNVEIDIIESDTEMVEGVSYVLTTLGVDF